MKRTIVFLIEYDGTNYSGWQRQKNANSIQETIERAIETVSGRKVFVVAGGRTDSGVHAFAQVAHSRIDEDFPIPEHKLCSAINSALPQDIQILDAKIIETDFHSTKDAIAREYQYLVTTKKSVFLRNYSLFFPFELKLDILNSCANIFVGEHDFRSFAKNNPSTKNYVCNIEVSQWEQLEDFLFVYTIKSNRFVYGLVRSLVGIMLDVARGRRSIEEVSNSVVQGKKTFPSPIARANGLFLKKIYYPNEKDFFKKNLDFKNLFLI